MGYCVTQQHAVKSLVVFRFIVLMLKYLDNQSVQKYWCIKGILYMHFFYIQLMGTGLYTLCK